MLVVVTVGTAKDEIFPNADPKDDFEVSLLKSDVNVNADVGADVDADVDVGVDDCT